MPRAMAVGRAQLIAPRVHDSRRIGIRRFRRVQVPARNSPLYLPRVYLEYLPWSEAKRVTNE